ncbi:MAG TPA: YihY/virulence factor BrkB family protein [Steroidobacteraceae bacterium]
MWARIWGFLDWCFFGPASTRSDRVGLVLRILRYPYAVIRDLWRGDINLRAMGLVYTSLLAAIPLVAFAFAILKIFGQRHDLEPIVAEFFRPMGGSAADDLARQVVQLAHRVSTGVAGSVGLAVLAYTLFGTIRKVEDSFNFVWHVDQPRSLVRRIGEYAALLVLGPLLLVGFLGLTHAALEVSAVQEVANSRLLRHIGIAIAPYAMVTAFFTATYMLVPNTRVNLRPALIGALVGGVLWAAVGKLFTEFVMYSTRLQTVYAGFAFVVGALLWTYFGWLILLAGAQLSFYIQNPMYLRLGLGELRLSCTETEQFALRLLYYVGRAHLSGEPRWTAERLAHELGVPGIAIARLVAAFTQAKLIVSTESDELVPARDIGQISVVEILEVARDQHSGQITPRNIPTPAVDRILATIDEARRESCGTLTLRDLVQDSLTHESAAPRPSLTLAMRRGD